MLLTHPAALKKSFMNDSKHHEWRFVILGFNSPWIHVTQTVLKKGKAVESKTLIVTDPCELHNMHKSISAEVCYEEAYLITSAHINQSWGCNQNLLKQIDRVVEHTEDHINIYHVYTVDNGRKLLSSAPLVEPDSRSVTTLYEAPVEVARRWTQQETICNTRRLEILRAASTLHGGDPGNLRTSLQLCENPRNT
ncbi:hypothetical protein [Pseudomonas ceruminis]|uniref:hypothetical protein n=2 Tax=Pseudomonas ceruminis TaxID=2740516 RepID=UPI001F40C4B7|nr:hypothetical protein [Pseudomonas ceruminis]